MNKIRLLVMLIVAAVLSVVMVDADTNRRVQPAKIKPGAVSEMKAAAVTLLQRVPFTNSRQGYMMVADVLDGFGGESESHNYRIPVNSGGQPSAGGISESDNYAVNAGYVHASHVNRGDANGDGIVNVGDIVYLVSYLYKGGPEPTPAEAGDVNLDGIINVGDIVYLVSYLYKGGPPPAC